VPELTMPDVVGDRRRERRSQGQWIRRDLAQGASGDHDGHGVGACCGRDGRRRSYTYESAGQQHLNSETYKALWSVCPRKAPVEEDHDPGDGFGTVAGKSGMTAHDSLKSGIFREPTISTSAGLPVFLRAVSE